MEDYPELRNHPGTPNYEQVIEEIEERWLNGVRLNEDEARILYEARPDLLADADFYGEDSNAA